MKTRIQIMLAFLMTLLLLTACGSNTDAVWKTITAEEAKARMDSGAPVTVVDVRTEDEYTAGHVPGAILIPNEEIGKQRPAQLPDLNAEILVYCRSGRRSAEAAEKLAKLGYTNVSDFGGIQDWKYETETGAPPQPERPTSGVMTGFTSTDLDGNEVDSRVLAGHKVTMVNIWATTCGPCLREMPDLGELAAEYDEKGAQIIGVVLDVRAPNGGYNQQMVAQAKEIVEKTNADYLHLMPSDDLGRRFLAQIYSVPTTFFVDENGVQVGQVLVGAKSKKDWAKVLDQLLEEVG